MSHILRHNEMVIFQAVGSNTKLLLRLTARRSAAGNSPAAPLSVNRASMDESTPLVSAEDGIVENHPHANHPHKKHQNHSHHHHHHHLENMSHPTPMETEATKEVKGNVAASELAYHSPPAISHLPVNQSKEGSEENSEDEAKNAPAVLQDSFDPNAPNQCEVFGWGAGLEGQLGIGSSQNVLMPMLVPVLSHLKVTSISCGYTHSAFIVEGGALYTCGSNEFGQLGHNKRQMTPQRLDVLEVFTIVAVSCGLNFTTALSAKGELLTWGCNNCGQLGDGTTNDRHKPHKVKEVRDKFFVQIKSGSKHTIALTAGGDVYAWGEGTAGQLGNGQFIRSLKPLLIANLAGWPVLRIAAGEEHSLALTAAGTVFAWGSNKFQQLGLGDTRDRLRPTLVNAMVEKRIIDVSCGANHTLFLSDQDRAYSVGAGSFGQLGHGSFSAEENPRVLLELMGSAVSKLAAGRRHSLALLPDANKVLAWGAGAVGQLGFAKVVDKLANPTSIDGLKDKKISSIYTAADHCFAIAAPYHLLRDTTIQTLSLDHIQQMISTRNFVRLQRELDVVFSSSACLNASFLDLKKHLSISPIEHAVDLIQVREAYLKLFQHAPLEVIQTLGNAAGKYIQHMRNTPHVPETLRAIVILAEMPLFTNFSVYAPMTQKFTEGIVSLPEDAVNVLKNWWKRMSSDLLMRYVSIFQGLITWLAKVALDQQIINPTIVLAQLYSANQESNLIPSTRFYNEMLSRKANLEEEYRRWKSGPNVFSLCSFPFLLDADAKSRLLKIDATYQMQYMMQQGLLQSLFIPSAAPFLVFVVRRDHIIEDTLTQLHEKRNDLKKPLKVVFAGEEGLDEGGVTKEFFQILVRQIFDPAYAIFRLIEETGNYYFNALALESAAQFQLIGAIIGLAIYNGVILDVHFPLVVYKKLLGGTVTFEDLKNAEPILGASLQKLLDFEGNVEETFGLTFQIVREVFGELKTFDLIPNGGEIAVTNDNRKEYVMRYVKWELDESVQKQFGGFAKGFNDVCGGQVLKMFRPEELEVLVTGSEELDFKELERVAQYKGYTAQSKVIRWFWEVAHSFTYEQKKKLLAFTTGLVRAPIRGLASLPFIIQRAGGDSDRLPASHACFNMLDLPEYSSKEKLQQKLVNAIEYSEGFGLR